MSAVPTAPAPPRNTWTCPTCRHGSPDPRDEPAHLDAHRQLGRFLEEWDAAVASDRKKERSRRPAALVLGALVAVAAMVTAVVFWGFHHAGGPSDPGAGPVPMMPAPVVPAPGPAPALTGQVPEAPSPPPDTVQVTPPAPQPVAPPSPAGTAPVATAAGPAPVAAVVPGEDAGAAPEAAPPPVPLAATSPEPLRPGAPTPPHAYLLQLCVVAICLTIP